MMKVQFSSVTQSSPTFCDPMKCSMPGLPVHHQLPEFTQTHIHWFGDAIQPSHPLSSPLCPPSVFPTIRVLCNESVLRIRWPKYWSFSFSISPSNEYPGLLLTGLILQFKGLLRVFSNTTVQNINSSALSFLYIPFLTSVHDYWKKHRFDYMDLCRQRNIFVF